MYGMAAKNKCQVGMAVRIQHFQLCKYVGTRCAVHVFFNVCVCTCVCMPCVVRAFVHLNHMEK
jgi:hypothetical protein